MSSLTLSDGGAKQVKIGVLLSYLLIIINTLYGLFMTPFFIGTLGEAEYGVYKTVSSFSASLMVLDLGMGGTVMRYVSKYRAAGEGEKIPNFMAMMLVQAAVLCGAVGLISVGCFFALDPMYSATFTSAELTKAKQLFVLFVISMLLNIVTNVVNGAITGSNRFLFGNGIKVARMLARIVSLLVFLQLFTDSLVIIAVDLVLSVTFLIIETVYLVAKLKIKPKLTRWERKLFLESGKYTTMMFLTSIAAQVNNNLDNVIIGAISGPSFVTVYSVGLLIFAMYENLSTSVSGVMLPTVSNILEQEDADAKIQSLIVKVGRIQFALLAAAVVGFACVGDEFVRLWLGAGFEDVYPIALILMIPSTFELCVNVCLAVLRAKNMLTFRTVTLFASTALNAIVTVIAVSYWSYIGAALGTAASFIVGSLIVMNVYYYKKLKLPMLRIYLRIFDRLWLCLLISGGVLFVSSRFITGSWFAFAANVVIFCAVYIATLLTFGLKREEKLSLPVVNKLFKKLYKNKEQKND